MWIALNINVFNFLVEITYNIRLYVNGLIISVI